MAPDVLGKPSTGDDQAGGPLVSIILPTYNGARYLDASISSCLDQSYRNLELIIVNDCSTDSTPDIIQKRAAQDARIRPITHETNKKLPGALNTGFSHARGAYLTWTSDDNLYQRDAIERMVDALAGQPDVSVVYAGYAVINDAGQVLNTVTAKPASELALGNAVGACFLYTKVVQDTVGPYDETIFLAEDYDFWLRAAQRFRLAPMDSVLYSYREHQGSLSASRCIEFSSAYCKAVSKSLSFLESSDDDVKGRFYFKLGVHLFASGQINEARKALQKSVKEFNTLKTWPVFAVNQLIYTHGGELRDAESLRQLLLLIPGLNAWGRARIASSLHVVAAFKAHRERNPTQVRFHFARAARLNPVSVANRGLLKIAAQACMGRTGR